ncbi:transcriptional regulator [Kutzneria kofuensis]|uniref:DNA-binding MarR family transcriptional regulator n=1 Tax=Kutzneria kofuensis TaxID=103725 RepID=A0A7W9KIC4_9PSEU|nr:transcriptional regulator [Kutzneria kofuensis]MBB5892803.1 DNA-binding MarR family transcriptional regulator [Kutzneria kofuensis]
MDPHPAQRLDDVVHQRVRLGILTVLSSEPRVAFTVLRDLLGQPDSGLSRHLRVLEDARLVGTDKVIEDRKPRTWISITEAGRHALRQELAALRSMMTAIETGGADPLAFATLLGDEPGERDRERADLVISEVPEGFRMSRESAVDSHYKLVSMPAADWSSHSSQALTFRSHGLLGGHFRSFASPTASAHVMLVELGNEEGPIAILSALAPSTLLIDEMDPYRGFLLDREAGGKLGICWLAADRYLACVSMTGEEEVIRELLPQFASGQRAKLTR